MKSGSNVYLPPPVPGALRRWVTVRALLALLALAPESLQAQPAGARVEPAAAQAALGSSVTFCIATDAGTPIAYQWQRNGVQLPGQTNACLALTNLTIPDGGSYRATVIDATGAVESEEATLIILVNILAGADPFGSGTTISATSNSVRGVSFAATREAGEPAHDRLSTSNSVWYTWRAPASGIVTFDTQGSTFDTVLAVYAGAGLNTLTELTSDDDDGGFHTSKVRWNAEADVAYHVVIDGVTGEAGTYLCNWQLEPTTNRLPVITLQPRSQAVPAGGTISFVTVVTDAGPALQFQWFRNDQPIVGATTSNLTLVNVQSRDLGRYRLAITNAAQRGVLTIPVELEIGPEPGVVSRDKIAEIPKAVADGGGGAGFAPSSASAGTFSLAAGTIINQRFFNGGTTDRCEPAHCGVRGGASRWFQVSAMTDGICTIDTVGSDVDTILAVYLQNFSICTNLFEPLVDCNNDALGSCDQMLAPNSVRERGSRISFFAPAGTIYRVVVDTVGGVRGTNLQFNVRFESGVAGPANAVALAAQTNGLLHVRGSSVTLLVASNFVAPGSTFQWFFNGRRIAGATRERLLLPMLNYSDAGIYSVTIQLGATQTTLPGAAVLVLDPCVRDGASNAPIRVIGTSPESVLLEACSTLTATSSWQAVGPIPRSTEPTLWDTGTGAGSRRFFRAVRPPP